MSPEILAQVVGKDSIYELWTTVNNLSASQSQSRITNLRIAITNTKKVTMSSSAYMAKMKSLGDELAAAGRPVFDPEMVDYILAGLDRDYDSVVAAIGAVKNTITADDLFAQISAFDQRMEMLGDSSSGGFHSSANAVYRGRGQSRGRPRRRGGRGRGRGDRGDRLPLLQIEEADSEDALDSNSNSRYVSSSMTILSARYASNIIQEVHVSAGGAMKRVIKRKRRRMLSPTAWTPIGTPTVQQQITSQVNLTS